MDLALSEIPFLEVITSILLMSGVDLGGKNHFRCKFSLLETLIYEKIVFLMHSSVTALTRSLENLKSSPQTKIR